MATSCQPLSGGWWNWFHNMIFIRPLRTRCYTYMEVYIYLYMWMWKSIFCVLLSSHCFCYVFCASDVGLLRIVRATFFYARTQIPALAALAKIAAEYVKVAPNGLIPTKLLIDALRFLKRSGLLNILLFCMFIEALLWSYGLHTWASVWYLFWIVDGLLFSCSCVLCPICCPGRLQLGATGIGGEEAQYSAIGTVIRMVMSHYRTLKKCFHLKQVSTRKARLTS